MLIPSNEELYKFYSNRSLLRYSKSINTLFADIKEELNIDKKSAIISYNKMIDQIDYINNCQNIFNELNKNDSYLYFYMNNIISNQMIKEYSDLNNELKYCANKYLYRISCPHYIFNFINLLQNYLPKEYYTKILAPTLSISFNNSNNHLDEHIKKFIIFKSLLQNLKLSKNKLIFIDFYNYSRFLFLFNIIKSVNLIPITYNVLSGNLYFTFPYTNKQKKEQIFEELHHINSNNFDIIVEEIKLYINTEFGEISNCKRLFDKKCNTFHIKRYIDDNISNDVPNIIRMITSNIILNYINKSFNSSYKKLLGTILNNNIIVENYCRKINNNGTIFEVPINNKWITMSNSEVRKLLIKDIDVKLLLNSYQELINPILSVVNAIKNR